MKQINLVEDQKFCVFQSNENWFGFPSLNVRSIVPRPEIAPLPHSDPVVVGVSHIQNEFLPVISLRSLLDIEYVANESEQQMLILLGPQSAWGLLIDRAVCLTPLETSISTLSDCDDSWSKVVVGSAAYSNQILQVLDADAIYRYAANLLDCYWSDSGRLEIEASFC